MVNKLYLATFMKYLGLIAVVVLVSTQLDTVILRICGSGTAETTEDQSGEQHREPACTKERDLGFLDRSSHLRRGRSSFFCLRETVVGGTRKRTETADR